MTAPDLAFADSLRSMIGWNQTLRDWQRMLALAPTGCFIAEVDRAPVGTVTTISYGFALGWVGMLLVHPQHQSRGIGRALLERALDYLREGQVRCVKLDATPKGQPLYETLGFKEEWRLSRWYTPSLSRLSHSGQPLVTPLHPKDIDSLSPLDVPAFGCARNDLLSTLAADSLKSVQLKFDDSVEGYGMLREGSRAVYLGPVVAHSAEAAEALITNLEPVTNGKPVYWDIPDSNESALATARHLSFSRERPLIRMFLGENSAPGNPHLQFAIADPALG